MRYEILSENFGPVGAELDADQVKDLNVDALVLGGFLREIAEESTVEQETNQRVQTRTTPAPEPESAPEED